MHTCPKLAANVSLVKRRSTLLIDGAGLAFHLYRTAYARRIEEVIGRTQSCCSLKNLKPEHVTPLLPNLLPLSKLEEVTREFVDILKSKHHMKLVVYFDGELRRQAKQATDEQRQERRPEEWSALQQYCCNGIMPQVDRICQLEEKFPKNRLFLAQVKYTLRVCQVTIVHCQEEADAEIARVAIATPNSYVVGNDTDFCFFPNQVRYIPLQTLSADSNVVTGCVITRKVLADALHLPDEAALVELAILMGNDYVSNNNNNKSMPRGDKLDFYSPHTKDILHHLRANGEGYRVTSLSGDETASAIRFARAFYNLQDLDQESPLCNPRDNKTLKDGEEEEEGDDSLAMKIPKDFPSDLAVVQPGDLSLTGPILRCLRAYVDQDNAKIQQKHLEAMQLLSLSHQDDIHVAWRPNWEDMIACYLIESCIAYVSKRSADSPLVRLSPPSRLFDVWKFHKALYKLQNPDETPPKSMSPMMPAQLLTQSNGNGKKNIEPRVILPIDEHEATILDAVNRNRVTIIQGETGCGTCIPIDAA
jgi:5'-3' exonuclease